MARNKKSFVQPINNETKQSDVVTLICTRHQDSAKSRTSSPWSTYFVIEAHVLDELVLQEDPYVRRGLKHLPFLVISFSSCIT